MCQATMRPEARFVSARRLWWREDMLMCMTQTPFSPVGKGRKSLSHCKRSQELAVVWIWLWMDSRNTATFMNWNEACQEQAMMVQGLPASCQTLNMVNLWMGFQCRKKTGQRAMLQEILICIFSNQFHKPAFSTKTALLILHIWNIVTNFRKKKKAIGIPIIAAFVSILVMPFGWMRKKRKSVPKKMFGTENEEELEDQAYYPQDKAFKLG